MVFAFSFSTIIKILLFLLILCATISIHELGHLLFAKKYNVYCYEYSIGFGKAIYTNKKGETHFCIRLIPLGGFVRMAGEEGIEEGEELLDNNEQPIPKERIFGNAKKRHKVLILAAGGLFNMALAFVCFFIYLVGHGVPNYNQPYVQLVENGEIAKQTDMPSQAYITKLSITLDGNDIVVDEEIKDFDDISAAINKATPTAEGQTRVITFIYKKSENSKIEKTAVVTMASLAKEHEDGTTSYYYGKIGFSLTMYKYNFFEAIPQTFVFMGKYFIEICKAFGQLFTGNLSNLSGLVGIYEAVDQASSVGVTPLIYIAGAISFSLGFFNLMPFPALDGGRIVFVLYEGVTGKKVSPKIEGIIHTVGIILLFGLMIIINVRDIIKLF